ncbi:glutaminase A [Kaistia dalseonensis]|uniref:Glutaminase n=1 Tax=Kaistia dalseonensis TaxID=410840 RepID=A0ABU0HF69_9HYPH|nr:glutaminase A [Kaistia dalseonensis]MCX5497736.1 glutaminase A [Kaistia dalseonensis]MDQ0440380.1 glutaminase [Kaistia dalseonensis]
MLSSSPSAIDPYAQPSGSDGLVADYLAELHFRISRLSGGNVATYIPELAKADPKLCGIAIATIDGKTYTAGDADYEFTIQSVSKPFAYGYALERYGREAVLQRVGVEPTGEAFNSIILDEVHNRPFNPMVNAGAIAIAETIKGATGEERAETMLTLFSRLAGRRLSIDEAVFRSEQQTGHRNRAIAYMMLNSGMIRGVPEDILDVYFRQCSVRVTCRDLAVMAATLANDGVNPLTGERAIAAEFVADVLTVMNTCGMYNYAGQWSYDVGIPAKSGVAGSILAVIPGQLGIAVFSPPIDQHGNSVRGVAACKEIAQDFRLNIFRSHVSTATAIRRELHGDVIHSKRARNPPERKLLKETGRRICLVEVQGPLFFGSAERLIRRIGEIDPRPSHMILDFRRVPYADEAACKLLARLATSFVEEGRRLLVTHLGQDSSLAPLRATFEDILPGQIFDHRDAALELCENAIIAEAGISYDATRFALAELDIFKGLAREDLKLLEMLARPMVFEAGDRIIRAGDPALLFFVVARGTVTVELPDRGTGQTLRLASMGPGLTFGEMALLDGGRRSADVVASERVVCYGFSVEAIHDLGRTAPHILTTIYANMMRDFSERLRRANEEIRALEH